MQCSLTLYHTLVQYLVIGSQELLEGVLVLSSRVILFYQLLPDIGQLSLEALHYDTDQLALFGTALSAGCSQGFGDHLWKNKVELIHFHLII